MSQDRKSKKKKTLASENTTTVYCRKVQQGMDGGVMVSTLDSGTRGNTVFHPSQKFAVIHLHLGVALEALHKIYWLASFPRTQRK